MVCVPPSACPTHSAVNVDVGGCTDSDNRPGLNDSSVTAQVERPTVEIEGGICPAQAIAVSSTLLNKRVE